MKPIMDRLANPHYRKDTTPVVCVGNVVVPQRNQSGERDVRGNISKPGDPMLRRALFEAANIMLSRVQRPFALQIWEQRIAEAKGNKRARIAVARKLAVLLHRLWLNETEFRWT